MRNEYKKLTFEDKFARKYYCNSWRFSSDMKKRNRKEYRRKLKVELFDNAEQVNSCELSNS